MSTWRTGLTAGWLAVWGFWAAAPCHAALDLSSPGARPGGLAGAFCALAEGPDLLMYNPAGLGRVKAPAMTLGYDRLLTGLEDGSLSESRIAYLQPVSVVGALGLSWFQRALEGFYEEDELVVGYGTALDTDRRFLAGVNLKWVHQNYSDPTALVENPFFARGASVSAFAFDLGALFRLTPELTLGAALANLNQPAMSLDSNASRVLPTGRAGVAYRTDDYTGVLEWGWQDQMYRYAIGGEAWWFDQTLGARAGLAAGSGAMGELTIGLSVRLAPAGWGGQLDYAFVLPMGDFAGTGGTHRFSLSLFLDSNQGVAEKTRARQWVEAGEAARREGRLTEALELWERAAEVLADDGELMASIDILREQIQKHAETVLFIRQGQVYENSANYINAAAAYRKALALEPDNAQALSSLAQVEKKIDRMTQRQKGQQEAKDRLAALRALKERSREARQVLNRAKQDLNRLSRLEGIRRVLGADLKQLEAQMEEAETLWRDEEIEKAQVMAETISSESEKLSRRAVQRLKQLQAAAIQVQPQATATATTAPQKADADDARQRKRARGAYGRAVKLMQDIDRLRGPVYFAGDFRNLKQELARIKGRLLAEDYPGAIEYAETIFPQMEKLKEACLEREKARKVMPTNW